MSNLETIRRTGDLLYGIDPATSFYRPDFRRSLKAVNDAIANKGPFGHQALVHGLRVTLLPDFAEKGAEVALASLSRWQARGMNPANAAEALIVLGAHVKPYTDAGVRVAQIAATLNAPEFVAALSPRQRLEALKLEVEHAGPGNSHNRPELIANLMVMAINAARVAGESLPTALLKKSKDYILQHSGLNSPARRFAKILEITLAGRDPDNNPNGGMSQRQYFPTPTAATGAVVSFKPRAA